MLYDGIIPQNFEIQRHLQFFCDNGIHHFEIMERLVMHPDLAVLE